MAEEVVGEIEGVEVKVEMIDVMEEAVMIEEGVEEEREQGPEVEIGEEEAQVIEAWVEAGKKVVMTEGEEVGIDLKVEVEEQAEEVMKEVNPDQGHNLTRMNITAAIIDSYK